jgi:hypothetical protein
MLHGSCLCGDVAFELEGELTRSHACHCTICRKLHGTAYGAYALGRKSDFRFTRGEDRIARYRSSEIGYRWFCSGCGSVLPEPHQSGDAVGIPLGTLEDAGPELRMRAHIFVASRAPWHEIIDALPRFDTWPPAIELTVHPTPAREPSTEGEIAGSCLCNAVAYVLQEPPSLMHNCHCSRCRKARGTPHATNAFTVVAGFRYTRGEDELRTYKVPEARFYSTVFCGTCSSPMPRVDRARDKVIIPAGSFDADPGVRPSRHIFVGSKAPWFEITDALPKYPEAP